VSRPSYGGVAIDDFVLVCASVREGFAAAGLRIWPLGVGKTAAAMHLPAALRSTPHARAVLLFGIAGAFPDRHRDTPCPVRHGGLGVVGSDRFGDEGVDTPGGFVDLATLGLADTGPFPANPRIAHAVAERLGAPIVHGVTVSTCSGTESASRRMAQRSGADVETMEGAAIAWACRQLEVPLLHVRAVSNWTGDRDRGQWDLAGAVATVQAAVRGLFAVG
jgi:futalosine hydrolase